MRRAVALNGCIAVLVMLTVGIRDSLAFADGIALGRVPAFRERIISAQDGSQT